jgi:hypothetical protein
MFLKKEYANILKLNYLNKQKNRINTLKSSELTLTDLSTSKICLIYAYYERKNEQKNQKNLSFFIKYGLDKTKWKHLDITYIFVINGFQCEVVIPKQDNIHIIKQKNCSDYEAWFAGIIHIRNTFNSPIWKNFDYLCLLNSSTNGPFMEEDINSHWLYPFYNQMKRHHSVACSPYINFIAKTEPNPGPALSCHFTLIKINEHIIQLLLNTQVRSVYPESINTYYELYYNTVIGPKKTKLDAILTGEYGLSRILIMHNYNVCCLYYDREFNRLTPYIEKDREEFYHKNNDILKNHIFIKNIWRTECGYASNPVLYDFCDKFINTKLNQISLFHNLPVMYNYNLLNINIPNPDFTNKQIHYDTYGYAENIILFPTINQKNRLGSCCAIYAHYDSNNIIADYVIQGIQALIYIGYDIVFYTASEKIYNIDLSTLPFKVHFITNIGQCTDWVMWLEGLNSIVNNKKNYDWIMMINDSLLFPINGIELFENTIIEMRQNADFWGHWCSNEVNIHLVGTPIEFKNTLIHDIIEFIYNKMKICKKPLDYIHLVETQFTQYLVSKGHNYNTIINYTDLNSFPYCPIFHPYNIYKWINNPNTFAIKLKYCISYLNEKISPELNYLTRFLYYGPNGTVSKTFPKSANF